ncbi:receptor-type adenylate cyclase, partial [Trypanosoma rangeli]
ISGSFMMACKSALAAVQLVRELQQMFLQHAWGTSVPEDACRKFEEGRAEEETEGYVPLTARLEAAVCRQRCDGLRVRVGVGTGLCDIRRGEVTGRYDYYGGAANMALSTAEWEEVEATALGAVALRGVGWGRGFGSVFFDGCCAALVEVMGRQLCHSLFCEIRWYRCLAFSQRHR